MNWLKNNLNIIEAITVDSGAFYNHSGNYLIMPMLNILDNFEYFKIVSVYTDNPPVYVSILDASYIGNNMFTKQEKEEFVEAMNLKYDYLTDSLIEQYESYINAKNISYLKNIYMPDYTKLKTKENI